VASQVALTVSVKIQPAGPTAATHRIFPDPRVYRAPLPRDVARKSNVHRYQSSHVAPFSSGYPRKLIAAQILRKTIARERRLVGGEIVL
jgi:hypothetical protein